MSNEKEVRPVGSANEDQHPTETGATIQFPEGVEPNINELFNRNPLEWKDSDLDQVVAHMRESRRLFLKGQETAKREGADKRKTSSAGRKALKTPSSSLSLDDLGL